MAKSKKNRKSTVDLIKKVSKKQTSHNPFEVHVNKSKFNVLGQKSKNDFGLPGVSRTKAIQKRKVTLLQEYKCQDKTNKFFDRRIGEHNKNMTKEDKIMARFTAEKMRAHNKQTSLFNLDDDVVLTHQGRTLEEIEQFEDPRSDEEDNDDGRNMSGKLDSEFVKEAHFGGGVLSVSAMDGEQSRKDLISQLIADSKKRKAEKQLLKESTMKLTEQLDTEWKDLLPLLNPSRGNTNNTRPVSNPTETNYISKPVSNPAESNIKLTTSETTTPTPVPGFPRSKPTPAPAVDKNSFDYLVQELRFEATGKPSDKLKSEEEVVRLEKEKLEKLERERQKRMNLHEDGVGTKGRTGSGGRAYRSADDLDDGFALENVNDDHHNEDNMSDNEDSGNEDKSSEEEDEEESKEEEEEDDVTMKEEEDEIINNEFVDKSNTKTRTKSEKTLTKQASENKLNKKNLLLNTPKDNDNMDNDEDEDEEEEGSSSEDEDSFDDLTENEEDEEEEEEEEEEENDENRNSTSKTNKKKTSIGKGLESKDDDNRSDENDDQNSDEETNLDIKNKKVKFNETQKKQRATIVDKGVDGPDNSRREREEKAQSSEDTEENSLKIGGILKNANKIAEQNSPKFGGILKNAQNVNKSVEFSRIRNDSNEEERILETDLKRLGTDLPFTFDIPTEYEELVELFEGRNEQEMKIILERMIKVNHWSLGADNKSRLNQLFAFLLQYLDDSVDPDHPQRCWQILNSLTPILFTLCLMDPDSSGSYLRDVIQEKYQTYLRRVTRAPTVHSLVFLKLVSTLFPTSDARHYVTTPALVFLCHALARVCPVGEHDMSVTLFLATLAVEYIDLSKRYLPELINYVQGCLLTFCHHPSPLPLHKPFKQSSAQMFTLDPLALNQELAEHGINSASNTLSTSTAKSSSVGISQENPSSASKSPSKTNLSPGTTTTNRSTSTDKNSHVMTPKLLCLTARDFFTSNSGRKRDHGTVKSGQCSSVFAVKVILSLLKLVNVLHDKYSDHYEASYLIFMRMRVALNRLNEEINDYLNEKQVEGEEKQKMDKKTEKELIKDGKKPVGKQSGQKKNWKKLEVELTEEVPVLSTDARHLLNHVRDTLTQTLNKLDTARDMSSFPYVAREKEKPKILRLFEPEIKPVLKFHTKGNQREREKLMAKYKKEMKGAVREIRKDGRFMQKVKMREMTQADEERKRKVKEILGGCANQEGEIRGLKRKKK